MYYIPQITSNDCLFTAFKILLANSKKDERYLYLQEDEKHGPYSFLEIIEKGKDFGVELFGFETDDKNELKNCKSVPLILNIKRGTESLHSVYVYKVTNSTVYYLDSDVGKVKMSLEKFISLWNGTGLMTRTIKEVENEPETVSIVAKRSAISKLLQLISALCFIIGIYFIDDVTNIVIPIVLLITGLLGEVLTKIIQINDMKKFDMQTMAFLEKIKSKNYPEFLPRREKLKISLFSSKNNFMFYLLSCAFVIFVILLNNPLNIACVFVPILLAAMQSLVIAPLEKKKNVDIECLEVKFSREKTALAAGKTLDLISEDCYKYAYYILGKNAIGIFMFFIASFLTLKFLGGLNLINIFFLTFTEIFLYQNLIPIFTHESRIVEQKVNYMKFINLLQ